MKVSVIIPSYNQGRFIGRTIDSVLSQKGVDLEIMVFDAGSKDGTIETLKSYKDQIKWVSEPDRGQTDAINKGLKVATGDIYCYLNSDDVFYAGALQAVVKTFEKEPSIRIIYGDADHIDENDAVIEPYYNEKWSYQRLLDICYICQPATFWRREITEEYGVFDDSLNFAMDYDYWLRIGSQEPIHYLKGFRLAGSRMYSDNKTMAFRLPVHREILKVARRKTATPYRWMKTLADMTTRDNGKSYCNRRNAINILQISEEYNIPLDVAILNEIAIALLEENQNQKKSLFMTALQNLREIKINSYIIELFRQPIRILYKVLSRLLRFSL